MNRFPWLVTALTLALVASPLSAPLAAAGQKADPELLTGRWKLDAPASANPNGPTSATGSASRGGGGSAGGFSGGDGGGTLGSEERARFYAMLKILEHAPSQLVIAATDHDVTITADDTKPFHHMTDGKKEDWPTGNKSFGNLEMKTKWEGATLKREIKTVDGLTVIESYALSADGQQLIVSLDLKSQVERLADAQRVPIKRVYSRAQ